MSPSYPPEPWHLRARMDLSTFLVPSAALPAFAWPDGYRPVVVGGRVPVGAAWVTYEPGGVLDYRELLVSVLVRAGARVRPHIVAIWVDSAASCAGGRELWGIPKGMAVFAGADDRPSCTPEGADRAVAAATVTRGRTLPGRPPVSFTVVQRVPLPDGPPLTSPVRTRSRLGTVSVRWEFDPGGTLGFLAGRRPLASTALRDTVMLFGMTPAERARQAISSQV